MSSPSLSFFTGGTNLGPLTTLFTPSDYCSDIFIRRPSPLPPPQPNYSPVGYSLDILASACWPPAPVNLSYLGVNSAFREGYFSPGVCMSGWEPKSLNIVSYTTGNVTAAECCPTGYSIASYGYSGRGCLSVQTAGLPFRIQVYMETVATNGDTAITFLTRNATSAIRSGSYYATATFPALQVRWQSSDLKAGFSAAATYLPALQSGAPGGEFITYIRHSPGVSNGSKIAIGIGVPLAILAILMVVVCTFLRKRAREKRMNQIHQAQGLSELHQNLTQSLAQGYETELGDRTSAYQNRPPSYRTEISRPGTARPPPYSPEVTT